MLENRWTWTARLEVRFRRPVHTDQTVTAVGRELRRRRGLLEAEGKVLLPDGTVAAEAVGTFAPVPDRALAEMSAGFPRLGQEWMVSEG